MNIAESVTAIPIQMTFRHGKPSLDVEQWTREEMMKLQRFYPRIMGCRVAIEEITGRREGNPWHVRIDLTVPGGEVVVRHEPGVAGKARRSGHAEIRKGLESVRMQKNLHTAIQDAFKSARRRLQDYARLQRGDTKRLAERPTARVTQIFPEMGYGFLTTPDGREIYFHKDSVLKEAFPRITAGTVVTFAEEAGEKGPQASSVRIAAKPRAPRKAKPSAA